MMLKKKCTKCGIEKALEDFRHNKNCKNEREGICKECQKEYRAGYHKANREVVLNQLHEYYEKNKEAILKQESDYRKAHREEVKGKDRKYYEIRAKKNKEGSAKDRKAYREIRNKRQRALRKSPDGRFKMIGYIHKRRAFEKETTATLTVQQWNKILKMQNNQCNMCKKKFGMKRLPTFDHIVPLSKGGALVFENVQALCRSCNCSKGAKLNTSFIQTWGL